VIRYTYTSFGPVPAPFVHVTLRCLETGKEASDVPALIDTGADCTVIPVRFVGEPGLVSMGQIPIAGFGGCIAETPTYYADVAVRSLPPVNVKVLASDGEPIVLLGRDVLNHFRLVLDGPGGVLEIG
jgi:predicted aspartyl protease